MTSECADGARQQRSELLELYKLHAEFADRFIQRRAGANSLYVRLLVALAAFIAAMFRFGIDTNGTVTGILCVTGLVGALTSVSWYLVIDSYRQRISTKFKALQELEKQGLAYSFFVCEKKLLEEANYRRLTRVEKIIPWCFVLLFAALTILSFFRVTE